VNGKSKAGGVYTVVDSVIVWCEQGACGRVGCANMDAGERKLERN
jgi:hypothetical protein